MDAQVFCERIGDNAAWAVTATWPGSTRIATIEQREGLLYVVPVLSGPCTTMLTGPYADLNEAITAIGTHIGGTCEKYQL